MKVLETAPRAVLGPLPGRPAVGGRRRGSRCDDLPVPVGFEPDRLADDLRVLGHPVRLQILAMLARRGGAVCVCDLERALPVKQPTISHHLRLLREAGLVETVRKGLWAYYFVRPDTLEALKTRVTRAIEALA